MVHSKILPVIFYGHEIPVWQSHGKPGEICITAGIDGDELEGIQAAYDIIQVFQSTLPPVSLTIIPMVNRYGFLAQVSENPLDHKLMKSIFPGKATGSPSEKIMAGLWERFIQPSRLWVDLHGGASDEALIPFIRAVKTQNRVVNTLTQALVTGIDTIRIYESKSYLEFQVNRLAKKHIAYCLLEAGGGSQSNLHHSAVLIDWVQQIVRMYRNPKITPKQVYTTVNAYVAPHSLYWFPQANVGAEVSKKSTVGQMLVKQRPVSLAATHDGTVLWHKLMGKYRKGEILIAAASGLNELAAYKKYG